MFGAVVGVVALTTVIGIMIADHGTEKDTDAGKSVAAPAGAAGEDGVVISVGRADAPSTFDVYEDFRCPACGQFEAQYHKAMDRLVDQGKARINYHIVSFIDSRVGGTGSKEAANAAACAQNSGSFADYHRVLYGHQPQETDDAFGKPSKLIELAGRVPGLKTSKPFNSCVTSGRFTAWVAKSQEAFNRSGYNATPTVLLNGKDLFADQANPVLPQHLAAKVEGENRGRRPAAGSSAAATSVTPSQAAGGLADGSLDTGTSANPPAEPSLGSMNGAASP